MSFLSIVIIVTSCLMVFLSILYRWTKFGFQVMRLAVILCAWVATAHVIEAIIKPKNRTASLIAAGAWYLATCIYFSHYRRLTKRPTIDDYKKAIVKAGDNYYLGIQLSTLLWAFGNKTPFYSAGFKLVGSSGQAREDKFEHLMYQIEDISKRQSIIGAKEEIFRFSDAIKPIVKEARKLLLKQGFTRGVRFRSAKKLLLYFHES
jgi:hypothetical protein